jgi:SAM-dependent methyltransferase
MKLATSWFLSASVSGYNQSGNGRLKMSQANSAQADYWSSASGYQWIAQETFLDAALATILDRLLERADIRPKENLLDVGCGTGASTLAAAAKTGPKGHVTGLDIAEQLLDRARKGPMMRGSGTRVSFWGTHRHTHLTLKASMQLFLVLGLCFLTIPWRPLATWRGG